MDRLGRGLHTIVNDLPSGMVVDPLSLAFSGRCSGLERPYREKQARESFRRSIWTVALTLLGYVLVVIAQIARASSPSPTAIPITHGIIVLVLAGSLAYCHLAGAGQQAGPIAAVTTVVMGGALAVISAAFPLPGNPNYGASPVLVLLLGYALLSRRFVRTTAAGWVITILYAFTALVTQVSPTDHLWDSILAFMGVTLVGMVVSYVLDLTARITYYSNHVLQTERARVKAVSEDLERQVMEHAAQLENANEALRVEMLVRDRAEKTLRASEQHFRLVVENAPLGIMTVDSHGWITNVNAALLRILGSPSPEAARAINVLAFPPLMESGIADDLRRCLQTGDVVVGEHPYTSKWGKETRLRLHLTPRRDPSGQITGAQAMIEDVTERARAESRLQQAQKMEAVGQVAGGLAHEFNNLLTVINGYADLAIQGCVPESDQETNLREIRRAGRHAAELTAQLLIFSRRRSQSLRPINLNHALSRLNRLLPQLLGENVSLSMELAPDLGAVLADASQIEQVVVNLALNARDAMPDGGAVRISTRVCELDGGNRARRPRQAPGPYALLVFADNGTGIPADTKDHLFEPFVTTDEPGTGTGLGLSVVCGIVRQSGGFLEVDSAPGQGTEFRIYFPLIEEAEEPGLAEADERGAPRGSEKILLVEDRPQVRRFVARALRRLGYQVLIAASGEEGLRMYRQSRSSVDLVLTDAVMPSMSGPEMIARIRADDDARVLYMTGYPSDALGARSEIDPDAWLLKKPFGLTQLARAVRQALDAAAEDPAH